MCSIGSRCDGGGRATAVLAALAIVGGIALGESSARLRLRVVNAGGVALEVAGESDLPAGTVLSVGVDLLTMDGDERSSVPVIEGVPVGVSGSAWRGRIPLPAALEPGCYRVTAALDPRRQDGTLLRTWAHRRPPPPVSVLIVVGGVREWIDQIEAEEKRARATLADAQSLFGELEAYVTRRVRDGAEEDRLRAAAERILESSRRRQAPAGADGAVNRELAEWINRIHGVVPCLPTDDNGRPVPRARGVDSLAFDAPPLQEALREVPAALKKCETEIPFDRLRRTFLMALGLLTRLREVAGGEEAGGAAGPVTFGALADEAEAARQSLGSLPGAGGAAMGEWFRGLHDVAVCLRDGPKEDRQARVQDLEHRLDAVRSGLSVGTSRRPAER